MIPRIDIAPLFGPSAPARAATDAAILAAAGRWGFLTVTGLPGDTLSAATRRRLLAFFDLPEAARRPLLRRSFAPENPNLYHGMFPLQPGHPTWKEGIDMGPDVAHGAGRVDPADPLTDATPLPPEEALPGWRATVAAYYRAMDEAGAALMRSLARGLGLPEATFDAAFARGNSTLRLLHYPARGPDALAALPPGAWVVSGGVRRPLSGAAHADSGFVTLLAQDGVPGLEAEAPDGSWIPVPPAEGALAVNFGRLLERWTGGRIRATPHRVLGGEVARFSVPFFCEPAVDAVIAPLPGMGGEDFAPFTYGDHLWDAMTRFVEMKAMRDMRRPRGVPAEG